MLSGLTALISLGSLRDSIQVMADRTARKILLAGEMNKAQALMLSTQRRMTLYAARKDRGAIERERQKFKQLSESVQKDADEIRPLLITEEGKEIVTRVTSNLLAWNPEFEHVAGLCADGKSDEAFQWAIDKTMPISSGLDKDLDQLVALFNKVVSGGQAKCGRHVRQESEYRVSIDCLVIGYRRDHDLGGASD
jgi:methyl-accepting chemotaxis protein/methyl-accepting chemotaxis protein-1 (serine sensor receptor)